MTDFSELESFLAGGVNPQGADEQLCCGVWTLAIQKVCDLVRAGEPEKRAARRVRNFLFRHAPFLASSRDALWVAFRRKLKKLKNSNGDLKALQDGRRNNGGGYELPASEIHTLRHSAVFDCGARINAAWKRKYWDLSEETRKNYSNPFECPVKVYKLVNRELVDALHARHYGGKRAVRKMIGGIQRSWEGIVAMHSWVVDDVTSNIEVAHNGSLILPQIIAVMDSASRKWVGWSISDDKAPTAELVCDAVLDAFRKNNIPKELWVENGWVFGRSLLVNGKEDDAGRTIVAGLGQYGCTVHHFGKMNPQAKAELERSFEAIQRLMERHPGYTGRHQMIDAPEEFRREQRLINSGKVEATKFRYTFDEFLQVMATLIAEYNSTPQQGHLKGLSPDEAFRAMADSIGPTEYLPELEWMFSNEKTIVAVGVNGVKFSHRSSGRIIRVRGGQLVKFIGKELWAWVDRKDPSIVTFMDLDYSNPFTIEIDPSPSARERSMAPGSGELAKATAKIREQEREIDDEYKRLMDMHGNPRRQLLAEIRAQSSPAPTQMRRVAMVPRQLAESASEMNQQRAEIQGRRKETESQNNRALRLARQTGIVMPETAQGKVQPDDLRGLAEFLNEKET